MYILITKKGKVLVFNNWRACFKMIRCITHNDQNPGIATVTKIQDCYVKLAKDLTFRAWQERYRYMYEK